jgi:hypothetical protein
MGRKELAERLSNTLIVIHDEDNMVVGHSAAVYPDSQLSPWVERYHGPLGRHLMEIYDVVHVIPEEVDVSRVVSVQERGWSSAGPSPSRRDLRAELPGRIGAPAIEAVVRSMPQVCRYPSGEGSEGEPTPVGSSAHA